jgi:hypothetical protein
LEDREKKELEQQKVIIEQEINPRKITKEENSLKSVYEKAKNVWWGE